MKQTIRTFIAIKINPNKQLLDQFRAFKLLFKNERINWVTEDNLHLTLRFIGNTTRQQLYDLVDQLEALSIKQGSFQIRLKGCGYFKSKGNPRVLFVIVEEEQLLTELNAEIETAVTETGFLPELKTFRPHVTLGRIKKMENKTRFTSIIDDMPAKEYQELYVSEFILYQSILSSSKPVYKIIQTFQIK